MYRTLNAGLIRAVAKPSSTELPPRPAEKGDTLDTARWRGWITDVQRDAVLMESIAVASPQLHGRLVEIGSGREVRPKQVRRAALALHRYGLRREHRATPFGLFAGVAALGPAGVGTELCWQDDHRPRARVDAAWLDQVVAALESSTELLDRLSLVAEPSLFVRDDRLILPCRPGSEVAGTAPGEVSVRHARPVQLVTELASTPVPFNVLVARVAQLCGGVPVETVRNLVQQLVTTGFLHTGLRAAATDTEPLLTLVRQLSKVRAQDTDQSAVFHDLYLLHSLLLRHDRAPAHRRADLRHQATGLMIRHCAVADPPLSVDLRLDCTLALPGVVVRTAETAADVLARVTPFPQGSRSWVDYHLRFLERYGSGAVVPLLELTAPDTGIGLPAGYRGSALPRAAAGLSDRHRLLLWLAQSAALEQQREIELTDALLRALDGRVPGSSYTDLPSLDMRFRLEAATVAALDTGDFRLVVNGIAPCAGATAGRFLDLLPATQHVQFASALASAPSLVKGARRVQVSSPPLKARTGNVARVPPVLTDVVSVGESSAPGGLRLRELGVAGDAQRLYLVHLNSGQVIEPAMLSAVDLRDHTHPLARFLTELPRARTAAFGPFAWGAADQLPFVPRVRHGRAILSPATWRISASELAPAAASPEAWRASLNGWRHRAHAPVLVEAGSGDRTLHLDLSDPAEADLLRAELNRSGHVPVREAAPAKAAGWLDGRAHEITLALGSTQPPLIHRARVIGADRPTRRMPGSGSWAFLKLYSHPERFEDLLTTHLPRLWGSNDSTPAWWFIRYRDPQPHLRLRIAAGTPHGFANLIIAVGAWADDLQQRGLLSRAVWDTDHPETGRYGSGTTLDAAEAVFAADSAAAVQQLLVTETNGLAPSAVVGASLVNLAIDFLGDTAAAMAWFRDHVRTTDAPHSERSVRDQALHLADPKRGTDHIRHLGGGQELLDAWTSRATALATYRMRLVESATLRTSTVLPSLLHMHHMRTTGPDEQAEHASLLHGRAAALSWISRQDHPS
ncbi:MULTISPECIES: lantibiotic dehydratase [Streptacidiphilus]|uniref:Lantibiotic dehydratase n=1 Tax=Streptacidiphilus cavernicola TaxID=3342716 RepID=A0ABV6V0B3_9ACTN|nr:lantibiotic dehydratase [Streptacidiphilus jeojiense]